MGRKSLLIAMLLAVASPLAAQEEMVWSSTRPDAQAPIGVNAARLLDAGQFQFTYRFNQLDSKGVWLQTDSLTLDDWLEFYPVVPLTLKNMTHEVVVAYGLSGNLTLVGDIGYFVDDRGVDFRWPPSNASPPRPRAPSRSAGSQRARRRTACRGGRVGW